MLQLLFDVCRHLELHSPLHSPFELSYFFVYFFFRRGVCQCDHHGVETFLGPDDRNLWSDSLALDQNMTMKVDSLCSIFFWAAAWLKTRKTDVCIFKH